MADIENPHVNAQKINRSWIEAIEAGGDRAKRANDEATALTRTKLREQSFARRIITPILLDDTQLDKSLETDEPRVIVPIEPDSKAMSMPFRGTGRSRTYSGRNAEVRFGMVMSETLTKSKFELMTYTYDIKKILSDNMVLDMSDEEDSIFYLSLQQLLAANPAQRVDIPGSLDRNHFATAYKYFANNRLPRGKALMTESLKHDLMELEASNIGDSAATDTFENGVGGKSTFFGSEIVTTIKADILPNNEIWFFCPENYLGRSFMLQDATLFVKQEGPTHTMYTYEAIGSTITNSRGFFCVRLT